MKIAGRVTHIIALGNPWSLPLSICSEYKATCRIRFIAERPRAQRPAETYRCQKCWLWRRRTPDVRWVSFWRKVNHFRGNQRIWTIKNLDWSFLCPTYDNIFANKFIKLFIALCLVTLQEQPSLPPPCLVKILTGWFTYKRMQHLEICLLTDLPTTGAYFSFQLTFKIIVFLSGSYCHKMDYNCCRVSISVFGFSSRKVPQRDLSMALFSLAWGRLRNGISTKVKVQHAGFYRRVEEKFLYLCHVIAFRSYIQG